MLIVNNKVACTRVNYGKKGVAFKDRDFRFTGEGLGTPVGNAEEIIAFLESKKVAFDGVVFTDPVERTVTTYDANTGLYNNNPL